MTTHWPAWRMRSAPPPSWCWGPWLEPELQCLALQCPYSWLELSAASPPRCSRPPPLQPPGRRFPDLHQPPPADELSAPPWRLWAPEPAPGHRQGSLRTQILRLRQRRLPCRPRPGGWGWRPARHWGGGRGGWWPGASPSPPSRWSSWWTCWECQRWSRPRRNWRCLCWPKLHCSLHKKDPMKYNSHLLFL